MSTSLSKAHFQRQLAVFFQKGKGGVRLILEKKKKEQQQQLVDTLRWKVAKHNECVLFFSTMRIYWFLFRFFVTPIENCIEMHYISEGTTQ